MNHLKVFADKAGNWIVPIHYSHDALKDASWVDQQKALYVSEKAWNKEMEIDFREVGGALTYYNFSRVLHVDDRVRLRPEYPVLLGMDFNVEPMIWVVCQRYGEYLLQIDEIRQSPANISSMVKEFKEKYANQHASKLIVYADQTGNNRRYETENSLSAISVFKVHMQDYPVPIEYRIPAKNPSEASRVSSVNARLQDIHGKIWYKVHSKCVHIILDMQEVVQDKTGTRILKIYDQSKDYAMRTHASDALGYIFAYEWPYVRVLSEVQKKQNKKKRSKRLHYSKVLGDL